MEEELLSFGTAEGSEALLSYFYEKTVSFLEYLPENTNSNFGDGQIIYNHKELYICKVQEDGASVMFTIQTKQ